MAKKTTLKEEYEKFHEALGELRAQKAMLTKAQAAASTAEEDARDLVIRVEQAALADIERAKAQADDAVKDAHEKARTMKSDALRQVVLLKGDIKGKAAFLRKQQNKVEEMQGLEFREVADAKALYDEPKITVTEKGSTIVKDGDTMTATGTEVDEEAAEALASHDPDRSNVAHAPGHE
jgi:phage-related minor tail protein